MPMVQQNLYLQQLETLQIKHRQKRFSVDSANFFETIRVSFCTTFWSPQSLLRISLSSWPHENIYF